MTPTPSDDLAAWAHPFRRVADARWFNNLMTGVIIVASIVVGIQTYPGLSETWRGILHATDQLIVGVFIIELLIRMLAYGNRPWRFFTNGWNVFDFLVVVACLVPASASFGAVLRLARVLRAMRLFSAIPRLQVLVTALIKSIPSIAYVGLLLFLQFYIYAVVGTTLFGKNDPHHFGTLHQSMLSLFRVVTMEDWTDIMYMQIYGASQAPGDGMYNYEWQEDMLREGEIARWAPKPQPIIAVVYFVSFVIVATYIVLNLFVGVVLSGMDEAQKEQVAAGMLKGESSKVLENKLRGVESRLDELLEEIGELRRAVARDPNLNLTEQPGAPSPPDKEPPQDA